MMKHVALAALASVMFLPVLAAPALASDIERACLASSRAQGNRSLCGCIQHAADMTLTRGDQRRAADFFRDPHEAQVVRQSDRASDESFWQRYEAFGQTAEAFCS